MRKSVGKTMVGPILACLCLFVLIPLNSFGKVYLETDTATGVVADITDQVITLDSGVKYYPAKGRMDLGIEVGAPVTLRYFTDGEHKNRYTEAAAGGDSLPKSSPPMEKARGFK